jgi:hypothetical protein
MHAILDVPAPQPPRGRARTLSIFPCAHLRRSSPGPDTPTRPAPAFAGWEDAVKNWQEVPKGGINRGPGAVARIWYNPAVGATWTRTRAAAARAHAARELPSAGPSLTHAERVAQILPLWGTIGLASVVCGGFMIKYFSGHTEVSFSKTMRATFDHQGLSESRVASHNSHFGMRDWNKKNINMFPFNFVAMQSACPRPAAPPSPCPLALCARCRECRRLTGDVALPLACADIAEKRKIDYE